MKKNTLLATLLLIGISASFMGCSKAKEEEEELPSTSVPFTAADIVKSWSSNCQSRTDAVLGTTQFKITLNLNANGTFSFSQYVYAAPSSSTTCAGADYTAVFGVSGTYTVGNAITGGQELNFTTTSNSSLMVLGTNYIATQNIFNTDCGGTSPYCDLTSGTCANNGTVSGSSKNSSTMLCQNYVFPTTSTTIYNVASWDGSNFYIGANTTAIPGVYSSGSVPSSATIFLY